MKLVPAGADRTRLFVLLGLLAVAAVSAWYMNRDTTATTAVPPATSNTADATGLNGAPAGKPGARQTAAGASNTPQALQLAKLEEVPEEPAADRNPFRFGQRKVIAPPPLPPPPPTPVVQQPPPGPPPIPPVPLKLTGIMRDPYGKNRAYLTDASGGFFEGVEGQTIDGRYRLLKVGDSSAVVSYLDGTGQRTLVPGR